VPRLWMRASLPPLAWCIRLCTAQWQNWPYT